MAREARILIADDRKTTRQGLRALLALVPEVDVIDEATNGQQCIELVAQQVPDMVLMDMQMPGMDGVEAIRRIKAQWPSVRVVALTMYAKYRNAALEAGADAFLLKDGEPELLVDAIMAQLHSLLRHTSEAA